MNLQDILNPEPHYTTPYAPPEAESATPSHLLLFLRNSPPVQPAPVTTTTTTTTTTTNTDADSNADSNTDTDTSAQTNSETETFADAAHASPGEDLHDGTPRHKERNWRWVSQTAVKKAPARKKNPNSYILFCLDQRENVRRAFPRLSHREVTAKLGQLWRDKSPQEKDDFCRRMRAQMPYRLPS